MMDKAKAIAYLKVIIPDLESGSLYHEVLAMAISALQAADGDAAPVVHGEWIEEYVYAQDPYERRRWRCSICGRVEGKQEPYCNCGAKMDGGIANGKR